MIMASISNLQIFTSFIIVVVICPFTGAHNFCYPAVFNFGDSNSDTGNVAAGLGFTFNPPYGETFFKKPSGRFSDGRLIIDFLMDAFNLPHLNPYLDALGVLDFKKGCNFAVSGQCILNCTFSIKVQTSQLLVFKRRALELNQDNVPDRNAFENGLYTFDIGQNDFFVPLNSMPLDQVVALIPTILEGLESRIKHLYDEGARLFWIHNISPLGCLPVNIAISGKDPSKLDEIGCVRKHNEAAKLYNLQLKELCTRIQTLPNANVTLVDIFSIKSNLIANHSQHGFDKATEACCGYGGPPTNYDANFKIDCNRNGSNLCSDPSRYVSWDGIHYTEAANRFVASEILTGKYFIPVSQPCQ